MAKGNTITIREDDFLEILALASLGLDSRELHPDLMERGEKLIDSVKVTMGWVMGPDGVLVTEEDMAVYAAEAKAKGAGR